VSSITKAAKVFCIVVALSLSCGASLAADSALKAGASKHLLGRIDLGRPQPHEMPAAREGGRTGVSCPMSDVKVGRGASASHSW
jgi:hypothetical protein